jgi:hypothetical protein
LRCLPYGQHQPQQHCLPVAFPGNWS